jgi:hypothetical protein
VGALAGRVTMLTTMGPGSQASRTSITGAGYNAAVVRYVMASNVLRSKVR